MQRRLPAALLVAVGRAMTVGIKPQASLVPQLSTTSVLTFEEVAAIPRPGAQGPSMVKFSPDDRYVTYLGSVEAASLTRQLYVYDRETGSTSLVIAPREGSGEEKSFSKEEALRRERARIMSTGVTEYSWAKNACRLLVPMDGALFVQDGVAEGSADSLRRLFDPDAFPEVGTGPLLDAKLSDDGARCFFVWGGEVCACEVGRAADECAPRRLTLGARGEEGRTNGLADYCAQEEMSRYSGYWPSPGGGALVAFEEVDESHIPPFAIMNAGVDSPHEQNEQHRYPFAGAANPKVRLGVVRAGGAADAGEAAAPSEAPTWFDLSGPFGADSYLARVQWDCGGSSLLVQVESRDQRSLALLRCDAATGRVSTVLTEQSDTWVNLHDMLAPLRGERAEIGCRRSAEIGRDRSRSVETRRRGAGVGVGAHGLAPPVRALCRRRLLARADERRVVCGGAALGRRGARARLLHGQPARRA